MKTIDTCGQQHYSPLIPAIKAMCEAGKGEKLEIIMDDAAAFNDMKEYLNAVYENGYSAGERAVSEKAAEVPDLAGLEEEMQNISVRILSLQEKWQEITEKDWKIMG